MNCNGGTTIVSGSAWGFVISDSGIQDLTLYGAEVWFRDQNGQLAAWAGTSDRTAPAQEGLLKGTISEVTANAMPGGFPSFSVPPGPITFSVTLFLLANPGSPMESLPQNLLVVASLRG